MHSTYRPSSGLFEVQASAADRSTIDVFPNERAPDPVPRFLYGKFCEHLGWNIYNGMWAQALRNPGFEGWDYVAATPAGMANRIRHEEEAVGVAGLMAGFERGLAFWWVAYGDGVVRYTLDPDAFNADAAQKVEVAGLASEEVGVMQPVFLPLHRERRYEFSLWARGTTGRLRVTIWDERRTTRLASGTILGIGGTWTEHRLTLAVDETVPKGALLYFSIGLLEPGTVWLDQAFLFPADHVDGFDPDVIASCRAARLPLLRYPGGNFASGYHWEDGIGPVHQRPTRLNQPWHMIEPNHVGTDEFMAFCRAVGCEPLICVNAGDGTPDEAAHWVEYCNGSVETPYGALRAKNGHPEPYGVVYWELGNELWGDWQVGYCSPETYARRYVRFYETMRTVDPSIKFIANGGGTGEERDWNAPLLRDHAGIVRSLSIHSLIGSRIPAETKPEDAHLALMAYTTYYDQYLQELADQMKQAGVADPKLAITELIIFTWKEGLPKYISLSEVLYLSGIIHSCIRQGNLVELITHTALVNHGGGLGKVREIVYPHPVFLASQLYATQSGVWPVRIRTACPTFDSAVPSMPAVKGAPCLDAVALLDEKGTELTLIVANRDPSQPRTVEIALHDFPIQGTVGVRAITGPSFLSENTWDRPGAVALTESAMTTDGGSVYELPPHSLTALVFHERA
ncbi:MAG: hypothetical protein HY710_10595 [Candidatus Latescibacteria bacterium]|nr:hypothetical protein [Candidatus Latescibacterota bacterium]